MKKTLLLFAFALATICSSLAVGQTVENPNACRLPDPIEEIYEDQEGLHIITKTVDSSGVAYNDILIELQDETDTYFFEMETWTYKIKYFRKGSAKRGTTGVFVVLLNELYRIDSHRLTRSIFATK
jgi:hypothetical protein